MCRQGLPLQLQSAQGLSNSKKRKNCASLLIDLLTICVDTPWDNEHAPGKAIRSLYEVLLQQQYSVSR